MQNFIQNWKTRATSLYERLDDAAGGVPGIILDTIQQFNLAQAPEAAASMAYYMLFSLFPMLLSIIAIGSIFLESARLQNQIAELVRMILPVGRSLINENIEEVLDARGAFGLAGAVGLLWSASAAFTILFRNINRAWKRAAPLNILKSRLIAVFFIILLILVLLLTRLASALFNLLPNLIDLFGEEWAATQDFLWFVISNLIPLFITFLIFLALFRWIPNTVVKWKEAMWGALLAAIAWELTTNLFTWVVSSGLVNYQLVYGSLGTIIALLFWLYLNNLIILFSAHLSAAIARKYRPWVEASEKPVRIHK